MGGAFAVLPRMDLVRTLEEGSIMGSVFQGPKDFYRSFVQDFNRLGQACILEGGGVRFSPEKVNPSPVLQQFTDTRPLNARASLVGPTEPLFLPPVVVVVASPPYGSNVGEY